MNLTDSQAIINEEEEKEGEEELEITGNLEAVVSARHCGWVVSNFITHCV